MEFVTKDNHILHVYTWDNVPNAHAVVLILHGMAEHAERYLGFAEFLNSNNYIVIAPDQRGHGKSVVSIAELGQIGNDGFNKIVSDASELIDWAANKYKLPVCLFAHSFGSFVAQSLLANASGSTTKKLSAAILCGSALRTGLDVRAGFILAATMKLFRNERSQSPLLQKLSFANYNKRFKNTSNSDYAWLSSDANQVKKYEQDAYCGTIFTVGFYFHFLRALLHLATSNSNYQLDNKPPLLLIAGGDDPVGNYGSLVYRLGERYRQNSKNSAHLKLKIYDGLRHELLNEAPAAQQQVYADVLAFIRQALSS